MNEKGRDVIWTVCIIIFVILLLVLLLISFGYINLGSDNKSDKECRDKVDDIVQLNKLKRIVDENHKLKSKIDRNFKRVYFAIRVGLILLWVTIIYGLIQVGFVKSMNDAVTYSEVMLLFLLVAHFVIFGTISNLNAFVSWLKGIIESNYYKNHRSQIEQFEVKKEELSRLEKCL